MKASSDFIFTEEGNDAVNTIYVCEVCVLQRLWRNGTSSHFFFVQYLGRGHLSPLVLSHYSVKMRRNTNYLLCCLHCTLFHDQDCRTEVR